MIKHTIEAFFYSMAGLKTAIKEEVAFRLLLLQSVLVLVFLFVYPMSYIQQAILLICIAISLITELLNSAIENTVDMFTKEWNLLAKNAKDMGSAAQFVASSLLYLQILLILLNK